MGYGHLIAEQTAHENFPDCGSAQRYFSTIVAAIGKLQPEIPAMRVRIHNISDIGTLAST